MLSFSRFILFILILIILPILVNIVDNLVKIIRMIGNRNYLNSKLMEFDGREFNDFILEFLDRAYKYEFKCVGDDTYIVIDNINWLLYKDNTNCESMGMYDIRNVIGVCESKGINNVFIFTTKVIDNEVKEFINSQDIGYNIKYFHGEDMELYYNNLVEKFY